MMDKIKIYADHFADLIVSYFGLFLLAAIVLYVGSWLIRKGVRFLHNHFHKNRIDLSLSEFLISIINVVLYVLLIISIASILGIPTTSFLTVLGTAGLAVGLALQGSLSNFAGGVLILLFKPFKVGHNITSSNNVSGTVLKIDILYTTLRAGNGTTIYAPNGPLANAVINNTSDNESRQAEYKINISFDNNIDTARRAILGVLETETLILVEPKPVVHVGSMGENNLVLIVRAWTANENFWPVYYGTYQKIKEALDAHDIKLPSATPQIQLISQTDHI
jgi:small conductance mechanosensitive channel